MPTVNARNLLILPDGRYSVEKNLAFFVRNQGRHRCFVFRYQFAGKRRDLSLGTPPSVTITLAKQEAAKCRTLLARGIDPKSVREEAKRNFSTEQILFKDFVAHALDEIIRLRKFSDATIASWRGPLKNHILPVIGNKKLAHLTVQDVCEVLDPIWEEKPTLASRIRGQLEAYFTHAKRQGLYIGENPATWKGNLEAFFTAPSRVARRSHNAAYTVEALSAQIINSLFQKKSVHFAFVFGALTATRQREFNDAQWCEIDFEKKIWTVPPERRKDRKPEPFLVPLSEQAIAVLKMIPVKSEYIFSGSFYNNRSVSKYYVSTMISYASGGTATMHGCRSTFKDWATRSGVDRIVVEKCLMHSQRAVEAAYQRDPLVELKRDALQKWADVILPMGKLKPFISD